MTDLQLDPEADDYGTRRQELLDRFDVWLIEQGLGDDGECSSDAALLIDWRANYSSGDLSRLTVGDLREFLLSWCPAKYSAPPSVAGPLCASLGLFIEFLLGNGQLRGGSRAAEQLGRFLAGSIDEVAAAMADTSRFGMAKSLFAGSDPAAMFQAGSEEELRALVEQRMAEHNALPFDQRRAITDPMISPELEELPFAYLPPTAAEIEESASSAPVLAIFDRLLDYLGDKGRTLTQQGNLKLADARALVDLLETGDVMDPRYGERTFKTRSSRDLRALTRFVEWATETGAAKVERGRLLADENWAARSAVDQVEECWEYLLECGPLAWQRPGLSLSSVDAFEDLIDDGLIHWLVAILPADESADVEEIVTLTRDLTAQESAGMDQEWEAVLIRWVNRDVTDVLTMVETAGIITWAGWREATDGLTGDTHRTGGAISLTAIGRHLVSGLAEEAGYRLRTMADLSQATAAELIRQIGANPIDPTEAVKLWRPDESASERGRMLAGVLDPDASPTDRDSSPTDRIVAFGLFNALGPDQVEASVRTLLDGPAGGHAALFLIEHDLADPADLADRMTVGPIVDAMSLVTDDPELLLELWAEAAGDSDATADRLIDTLWRYDSPETVEVLEALGKLLPDKRQAKAARKAVIKHRSRLINQ